MSLLFLAMVSCKLGGFKRGLISKFDKSLGEQQGSKISYQKINWLDVKISVMASLVRVSHSYGGSAALKLRHKSTE